VKSRLLLSEIATERCSGSKKDEEVVENRKVLAGDRSLLLRLKRRREDEKSVEERINERWKVQLAKLGEERQESGVRERRERWRREDTGTTHLSDENIRRGHDSLDGSVGIDLVEAAKL